MKAIKKIISLLLLIATLASLVACGEFQEATRPGGSINGPDNENPTDQPPMNDDPTDDFVVTVTLDGKPYVPRMDMDVIWTSGSSVHRAPLGRDGIARIDGLDGDYRVTLSAVPNEVTYNPNVNVATNDKRSITLALYTLNILSGKGDSEYNCYSFKRTGVYSATIDDPSDAIFFEYAPSMNGVYTIESWIDTTADQINPYIEVWGGHSQNKFYSYTKDDGGPVGSYTINFVHEVKIAEENISNAGQVTFTFAVKAESKNNKYPITVTFAVKRNGDFELPGHGYDSRKVAIPTLDFATYDVSSHEYDSALYKMSGLEYPFEGVANTYVFDDSLVKLWKRGDGGDNFYHVYDKEKYPETDGYGPILYARISSEIPLLKTRYGASGYVFHSGNAITGNSPTFESSLYTATKDYTHFIKGYSYLSTKGNVFGSSFYCVNECPCHRNSTSTYGYACAEGCTKCDINCTQCPEELIGNEGYQSIVNSDGMVAVTEELRDFIVDLFEAREFFNDGEGSLERENLGGKYYQAVGESSWLIACVYYVEK